MTDRIRCCVPFCRRTHKPTVTPWGAIETEWICGGHWRAISDRRRRAYNRKRRLSLRDPASHWRLRSAVDRLWFRLKRIAIERAAGVS